jgi:hypothetical protein
MFEMAKLVALALTDKAIDGDASLSELVLLKVFKRQHSQKSTRGASADWNALIDGYLSVLRPGNAAGSIAKSSAIHRTLNFDDPEEFERLRTLKDKVFFFSLAARPFFPLLHTPWRRRRSAEPRESRRP